MKTTRKSPKHSQTKVNVRYRKTGKIQSAVIKPSHRKASVHEGKLKSVRKTSRHTMRRK